MTFVSKKLLRASTAFAKALDFPSDSISNGGFAELSGNTELRVYSAEAILSFCKELVCIACPLYVIRVKGMDLCVTGFVGGSLTVSGIISAIELDGGHDV